MVNTSTPFWIHSPKALHVIILHSQTSHKQSPKMQRLRGRLREDGRLQESNHSGGLFLRKGPGTSLYGR